VLREPGGNLLLLGPSACGRKSLIQFATEVTDYELFHVQPTKRTYSLNDYLADMKKLVFKTGVEDKQVVYLLSEEHMTFEILDRLEDFMRTGSSPVTFSSEEVEKIVQDVRVNALVKGHSSDTEQIFRFFLESVRGNLHLVLLMRPKSDTFKQIIYNYPTLANFCTVDCLSTWNLDDCHTVVSEMIGKESLEGDLIQHKNNIIELAADIRIYNKYFHIKSLLLKTLI
jgi:dynein heavy chain